MIKYYTPYITSREIKAANRVLRSGYLAQGQEVETLEKEYSEHCGGDYCIAVSSATAGLYLVCKYMKLYHEWKEINIPAYTFCATYQAAKAAGFNVKICDVDNDYLLNFISENNIFVSFAGKKSKTYISNPDNFIIDAAHCFPGISESTRVHSLYPTKPIASNGGGMIVTKNKELADWCRLMRQHGRQEAVGYAENPASIGFNFWMSDLTAAIARVQLQKIAYLKNERKRIVNIYLEGLKGFDCYYGDHLFLIRLESCQQREIVEQAFIKSQTEYSRPYIPLATRVQVPNSWNLYDRSLSIPYFVSLPNGQIKYIIDIIKRSIK